MTDILPPGNTPAWADADPANQIAQIWAGNMWPALWPKMVFTYANTAARDADLVGLGPSDAAYAYLSDKAWLTRWTGTAWRPVHPVWGSQAGTFSAGLATITHNLGFTPTLFLAFARVGATPVTVAWQTGTTNTTTAVVRAWDGSGSAYVGTIATVGWVAYP